MAAYRELHKEELRRALFADFIRRQVVVKCYRRENGAWTIKDAPFIDDWSETDYCELLDCLRHTVESGGFVYGAFVDGRLKGFVSVESEWFCNEYLDLSSIYVSEDQRGNGIGRALFQAAKEWARGKGAKKLYISAHSAIESQAFYRSMGCVDAQVYHALHVEKEPFDRQLECLL